MNFEIHLENGKLNHRYRLQFGTKIDSPLGLRSYYEHLRKVLFNDNRHIYL